jgi:parvulin-like peptidyl-prolyl isomerase
MRWNAVALVCVLTAAACGPGSPGGPTINNHMNPPEQQPSVVSTDILARDPVANQAEIVHILIGWNGSGEKDERALKRSKPEAETLVRSLLDQLAKGGDFEALMKQYSEDPGSAHGASYKVAPDAELVIEFKQLGLRLKVGEYGVVESEYGFHIMKRLQ